MARMPGALWVPIEAQYLPGRTLTACNRVNLHVAVSEGWSLRGFFNFPKRPSSHFYVRRDGTVEQYVDTAYRAEADLDGNDATISVETQGGLFSAQAEPWTPEQVEALARIYAWAVTTHGVALQVAQDSRVGVTSHGLSWHRLGIDPWRVPGGMRYSASRGKVCPGDAKIAQVATIFARALALLGGAAPAGPATPSTPTTPNPPARVNRFGRPLLAEDGDLGAFTISEWQRQMGTPADGVISKRSSLIRAVQRHLITRGFSCGRSGADGRLGPATISALQRYLGTPVDGVISTPSTMVRALQRRLNSGGF